MGNANKKTPDKFGYKVDTVIPLGPGEKCGLVAAADLIIKVDGKNVYTLSQEDIMEIVKVLIRLVN